MVYIHRKGDALKNVYTPDKIGDVSKTTARALRISDEDWEDLGTVTDEQGTNRTAVVTAFIAWYLRRKGAKLPKRPPAES